MILSIEFHNIIIPISKNTLEIFLDINSNPKSKNRILNIFRFRIRKNNDAVKR